MFLLEIQLPNVWGLRQKAYLIESDVIISEELALLL